jgi:uncharacterized membrane protein
VRAQVTEGTSALFLLSSGAVMDKIAPAFEGVKMDLIQSNMSAEQEAQLKEEFGA